MLYFSEKLPTFAQMLSLVKNQNLQAHTNREEYVKQDGYLLVEAPNLLS